MAARLAFTRLTRAAKRSRILMDAERQHQSQAQKDIGRKDFSSPGTSQQGRTASTVSSPSLEDPRQIDAPLAIIQGDPVTDLGFLCFANVSTPYPSHWVQLHGALRQALEAAVVTAEHQLRAIGLETSDRKDDSANQRAQSLADVAVRELRAELASLDLEWFVTVLSRLHINVFRVGCMLPPPSSSSSPLDEGANGGGSHALWPAIGASTSGSAAYLVASLFNHSCEPNMEVVFRRNDSVATFVASRDIDKVRSPSCPQPSEHPLNRLSFSPMVLSLMHGATSDAPWHEAALILTQLPPHTSSTYCVVPDYHSECVILMIICRGSSCLCRTLTRGWASRGVKSTLRSHTASNVTVRGVWKKPRTQDRMNTYIYMRCHMAYDYNTRLIVLTASTLHSLHINFG